MLTAVSDGPEFLVNSFADGSQWTFAESQAVAANSAGDTIVAFAVRGAEDNNSAFVQKNNSDGGVRDNGNPKSDS